MFTWNLFCAMQNTVSWISILTIWYVSTFLIQEYLESQGEKPDKITCTCHTFMLVETQYVTEVLYVVILLNVGLLLCIWL